MIDRAHPRRKPTDSPRTNVFRANDPEPARTPRSWLIGVVAVALLARLAFVLTLPVDESAMVSSLPDQREYLELARSLLSGQGLRFVDPRFADEVRAFRPPGYPLLVAGCGGSVIAVRVVQSALDASTVLATYLLARRWLSSRFSVLAAAGVAVNPFLIYFCSLVLTETLFTALLAWSIAALAHARSRGGGADARFWIGVSLCCAAVYVKPSAVALPVALAAAAAVAGRLPQVLSLNGFRIHAGAAALAVGALALLPWGVRNRIVLGEWVWTSTNDGFTLYDGLNPDADGSSNQTFVRQMPVLQTMTEPARSEFLSRQAFTWASQNPGRVVELAGRKLIRTWSPVPLSVEFGGRPTYQLVAAAYTLPLFVCTLIGVLRKSLSRPAKLFLLVPAIYFSVAHSVTVGSLRYRVPVEPMLCVLAASALAPRRVSDDRKVGS